MNKTLKGALIIGGTIAIIAAGVWWYLKNDKATLEQFEKFKSQSLTTGWDVLLNVAPDTLKKLEDKWVKNLTKSQADRLIELSMKKESGMTISEKMQTASLIAAWLKSDTKS